VDLKALLAVARGDAPADLVFRDARIVNTFTGELEEANVAIFGGRVAGVGDYTEAARVIDLKGKYLAPGLIDGHFHLESGYLSVGQFVRAVVPHGTLGGVTDLHEIANVCGLEGLRYLLRCARRLPFDLFLGAPSCVPATNMETSGARLGPREIRQALRLKQAIGLGEFMDFPSVIRGDAGSLAKLGAAGPRVKDGHAPGVSGRDLNAYLAPLISSDHETTRYAEGLEKLRRGMYLMIREGSSEKNLEELLPLVTDHTYHRCMLVVDDRNAQDLYNEGDVDAVVRKAIRLGLAPIRALQLATIVPAGYFRLQGLGGIAPGYWANLLVLDDLEELVISSVYYRGRLVAREGKPLFSVPRPGKASLRRTVNVKPFAVDDLALRHADRTFPIIEIVPGQIVTRWRTEPVRVVDGVVASDPERDLLKLVVVERHRATGNIAKGLVKGFGLKKGALATSVAHDSHNIVAVGVTDQDIYAAVREIEASQGGLVVAADGQVVASLALPVAGLLSESPLEEVVAALGELERAASELGCVAPSPFSLLSFLALPVIPELRLTDLGLVDVGKGQLLSPLPARSG
jgi:adenine deaminase